MIRYPVASEELENQVRAEAPGWLEDAASRTEGFRKIGRYEEAENAWGRVKEVFRRLQHNKCAYCERKLGAGSVEYDVDHYRPKSSVKAWPTQKIAASRKINFNFSTGRSLPGGYYLLAYQLSNYAVACKTCNTHFKATFFPVASDRVPGSLDPLTLRREMPFLIYPIGDLDEDPEDILTFEGVNPVPKVQEGHQSLRASVTIRFFELDSRGDLSKDRAELISHLAFALESQESPDKEMRDSAENAIKFLLSPASGHTNCARAFYSLYKNDRPRAMKIVFYARSFLATRS